VSFGNKSLIVDVGTRYKLWWCTRIVWGITKYGTI
jgi:hypothetical protein